MKEQSWYDREMDRLAEDPEFTEAERQQESRRILSMTISTIGVAGAIVGALIMAADVLLGSTKVGFWVGLTMLAEGVTIFMVGWAL